jgi:uncharacterized protein (TIGR02391 family)
MATRVDPFPEQHVQAIADILGGTHSGLTGTQIGRLLASCHIDDVYADGTKRYRLYEALAAQQRRDGAANSIIRFITTTMSPVRYVNESDVFDNRRSSLNAALSFLGLRLGEDGVMRRRKAASTLSESAERTKRLRDEMHRRGVHSDVLRFCQADLLEEDCFDAVFEATKGLAERIRETTGLIQDGSELVDLAFGFGPGSLPLLAFNSLRTPSEQSEHRGLANLMKGVFGTFRNPAAHVPKVKWPVSEADALDLLTTVSMIQRRLDRAVPTSIGGSAAAPGS